MSAEPLPSRRQILVSVALALAVAVILLLLVILPAEYGVDPTRLGRVLGLTQIGEAKRVAAQTSTVEVMHAHPRKFFRGRVEIAVKPKEELEYKAALVKGEPVLYSWSTQGGPVYFEFHGEPTAGKWPKDFYQSYEIQDRAEAAHGSFVAPFTGNHGWYWRNLNDQPITIVLEVHGYYSKLERVL